MLKAFRLAAIMGALLSASASAEVSGTLRIGVLNDMSSVYADFQGPGSVLAAQMAVEDFAKQSKRKVEVVSADHQNKPDIGAGIARRWLDVEGVDMIIDLPNSAVALAVGDIVREKNKVAIGSGAGTAALTGAKCSPNFVHWTYDTWAFGHGTARGVLHRARKPGSSSPPIMPSVRISKSRQAMKSTRAAARCSAVCVIRSRPTISHLFCSKRRLRKQRYRARQRRRRHRQSNQASRRFQSRQKAKNRGTYLSIYKPCLLSAQKAQGLQAINAWYWDLNDQTRAWSKRYQERHPKKMMPNHMQAGVYSAVLHYLKAVEKVGSPADGAAVVAAMKAMPTDDSLYGKGTIRVDGRKIHPLYLLQVKTPEESKSEWDVFKIVGTIPADKAFRPLNEGGCPLSEELNALVSD